MNTGTKWQLYSMNAFIDGITINDFNDDAEAIQYAANYEATCYRIDPDGSRTVIYQPGQDDILNDLQRVNDQAFNICGLEWYSTDEERGRLIDTAAGLLRQQPGIIERITRDDLEALTDYNLHIVRRAAERVLQERGATV